MLHEIHVSVHALSRFRQRYLVAGERDEVDNDTASHWLNALIRVAIRNGLFEDVLDKAQPARIVEIAPRRHGFPVSYAVIREFGTPTATIVTLLSAWMRDQNRRNRWVSPSGDVLVGTPTGRTGPLRSSLADVAKLR